MLCPGIVDSSLWRAGERCRAEFGDPSDAPATGGTFMARAGMPAAEVAAAAAAGIRTGQFYMIHGRRRDADAIRHPPFPLRW
ncbi:MAG: hypothetical protein OXU77_03060 [Gammaproteobacteria bacterium]|nr:hypothetical protein [Gammaproteobacteria bacterium]